MDHFFNEQNCSAGPYGFRRQQCRLYQELHPDPDVELNIEEVEAASAGQQQAALKQGVPVHLHCVGPSKAK
ncbi:hypothetical protein DPMN_056386 [Dreissena polymorpha]|uniref:Uncharacterized protein n=1 Tax=Dreissena polymorpha TaxID=45954 RepID=A0A9D4CUE2_DREPO|nr:hypothetical protein DPMN_056386 [Dreissena polymorpha]